ncbi:putative AIM2 family protein [Vanrija pseudolonga]|nr:purtative AIM2 family protein [Vanrija pseudolonga]
MSKAEGTTCCPPSAPKPKVAHPVSEQGAYEPRGKLVKAGDFEQVYVTGPDDAEHAILVVYDIFGFWETTLRGSDLLVSNLQLTLPHKVFMPDLFRGKPFPPDKDGDKEELGKFFAGTANLEKRLPEVIKFAEYLKNERGFHSVSLLGYCWGGKITLLSLSSQLPHHESSVFTCGATVHPAMIAVDDGKHLDRPLAFFPSKDEPKDVIDSIVSAMQHKKFEEQCAYHFYNTVHHGWAAARADLNDPENFKQYEDVYQRLADYFARVDCASS